MAEVEVTEQFLVRKKKMEELREMGVEPFGAAFDRTHTSKEILDDFESLDGKTVTIAGRIMAIRGHGKAAFLPIQDKDGQIQVYLKLDVVGEEQFAGYREYFRRKRHGISHRQRANLRAGGTNHRTQQKPASFTGKMARLKRRGNALSPAVCRLNRQS